MELENITEKYVYKLTYTIIELSNAEKIETKADIEIFYDNLKEATDLVRDFTRQNNIRSTEWIYRNLLMEVIPLGKARPVKIIGEK